MALVIGGSDKYWGRDIYEELECDVIINLASNEYFKAIEPYLEDEIVVTCTFLVNKNGAKKNLSTWAKKGRGMMLRFMAENLILDYRKIKLFSEGGFKFTEEKISDDNKMIEYIFLKE